MSPRDTVRAVRARWALHDRRWAPLPLKRYAPRPWWPVHPWGYYAGPGRPDGRRLTIVRQP